MQRISLNSQRIDLSNDINHVLKRKFKKEEPDREMKKYIFSIYFLNQYIFNKNVSRHLKCGMHKDKGHIERTVSHNFYLGFSFYCM